MNKTRLVSLGAVFTSLAVLFQSAPVFLPAAGFALSPLSTFPIAVAAVFSIPLGIAVFFSSSFLLLFVDIQEALLFTITTGLLGITIGSMLYRKGIFPAILVSSIALFSGILILIYFTNISGFSFLKKTMATELMLLAIFGFTAVYSGITALCIKKLISFIKLTARLK